MTLIEPHVARASGTPPPATGLRVITGGQVGNMEARLGTSGFDVVAVADTEADLMDAVAADEADAIVVEADLCPSLEHVRELAPDAVLIVVGDHTPAGALGRIERGVSGTVMAGLLHALVTDGFGAAVVWGLVPAIRPPGALHLPHVGGSLASAKLAAIQQTLARTFHSYGGVAAAAGTVAISVSASVLLVLGPSPRTHERVEPRVVDTSILRQVEPTHSVGRPVSSNVSTTTRHVRRGAASEAHEPRKRSDGGSSPGVTHTPGDHGSIGTEDDSPPPGDPPSSGGSDAQRPPGVANGWDIRPPKHDDNGHHTGWDKNADKPAGSAATA